MREGRVEVCYNQAWGTICDEVYGPDAAGVICKQLGFRCEFYCTLYPEVDTL